MGNCCSSGNNNSRICIDGKNYVKKQLEEAPKNAILCCEGGCIKGEIARNSANILAYRLERDNSVRICLGDAATADSGMIDLLKRAPKVIAVEGCPLHCGTEIIKRRIPDFQPSIITTSELYTYDKKYFEIFDMPREEIEEHSNAVAKEIQARFFK